MPGGGNSRGTPHFEYVAAEVTKGIAQVGLNTGLPVIYGVITADTLEQAIERAGTKQGNEGAKLRLQPLRWLILLNLLSNLPDISSYHPLVRNQDKGIFLLLTK